MKSSEIRLRKLKLRLRDKRFANHKAPCTAIWQQPLQSVLALRGRSTKDLILILSPIFWESNAFSDFSPLHAWINLWIVEYFSHLSDFIFYINLFYLSIALTGEPQVENNDSVKSADAQWGVAGVGGGWIERERGNTRKCLDPFLSQTLVESTLAAGGWVDAAMHSTRTPPPHFLFSYIHFQLHDVIIYFGLWQENAFQMHLKINALISHGVVFKIQRVLVVKTLLEPLISRKHG